MKLHARQNKLNPATTEKLALEFKLSAKMLIFDFMLSAELPIFEFSLSGELLLFEISLSGTTCKPKLPWEVWDQF